MARGRVRRYNDDDENVAQHAAHTCQLMHLHTSKQFDIGDLFFRKIHYLTREFHVKFHAKNRYRTNREAMSAISVFQVKFNVEFTSQVMDFP